MCNQSFARATPPSPQEVVSNFRDKLYDGQSGGGDNNESADSTDSGAAETAPPAWIFLLVVGAIALQAFA